MYHVNTDVQISKLKIIFLYFLWFSLVGNSVVRVLGWTTETVQRCMLFVCVVSGSGLANRTTSMSRNRCPIIVDIIGWRTKVSKDIMYYSVVLLNYTVKCQSHRKTLQTRFTEKKYTKMRTQRRKIIGGVKWLQNKYTFYGFLISVIVWCQLKLSLFIFFFGLDVRLRWL